MKLADRIKRQFIRNVDHNKACEGIIDIFVAPLLSQVAAATGEDRDFAHVLGTVFCVAEVKIDVMVALRAFDLPGDVLVAPHRRVPGMRGLVVSPGAQVWVRQDLRHRMVDVEVCSARSDRRHPGGELVWVSMTQEEFDCKLRGGFLGPWKAGRAKEVRARHRDQVRRSGMHRPWVQARPSFPCS
jgi:hypothetical protein